MIFIIDEFDLFATHARQTLLYNLLRHCHRPERRPSPSWGLLRGIDVVESLEKQVKSRFSHRYVYLSLAEESAGVLGHLPTGPDLGDGRCRRRRFRRDATGPH